MSATFVPWLDAVDLLAVEAGLSADHARRWVVSVAKAGGVRLMLGRDVLRYSDLPEVAAARSMRSAVRERPAGRYNPFGRRDQRDRPSPARPSAADPAQALSGCAIHLGDLEKAIVREFEVEVVLCGSGGHVADTPAAKPVPIVQPTMMARALDVFRERGRLPGNAGLTRDGWRSLVVSELGISLKDADFDVVWKLACDQVFVIPLKGAPKLEQQNKRALQAMSVVPICTDAPIADDVIPIRKASVT